MGLLAMVHDGICHHSSSDGGGIGQELEDKLEGSS